MDMPRACRPIWREHTSAREAPDRSTCRKGTYSVAIASSKRPVAAVMKDLPRSRDGDGAQLIIGEAMANIPWQLRPAGDSNVVWRYSGNPVIRRDLFPGANSIFNSAVVSF